MKYLRLYENFDNKSVFTTPDEIGVSWISDLDDSGVDEDLISIYHVCLSFNDFDNYVSYSVFKIDNKFFLTNDNDEILDYDKEIEKYTDSYYSDEDDEETITHLQALKKIDKEFLKKFTYEYQKEFLTKFPERVNDLKPFGIHKKIKEEFADIIEGNEFGFFGLI